MCDLSLEKEQRLGLRPPAFRSGCKLGEDNRPQTADLSAHAEKWANHRPWKTGTGEGPLTYHTCPRSPLTSYVVTSVYLTFSKQRDS